MIKRLMSNGVTLFIAVGAVAVIAFDFTNGSSKLLPEGTVVPPFVFDKLGGGQVSSADFHGDVMLVDFWATWCPPCRDEMPWLVQLAKEYESKGVHFVAVSEDEQRPSVGIYAKDTVPGLEPYAVFANAEGVRGFRIEVLPTLYVIGRDGKVLEAVHGETSEWRVRRWLDAAIRSP